MNMKLLSNCIIGHIQRKVKQYQLKLGEFLSNGQRAVSFGSSQQLAGHLKGIHPTLVGAAILFVASFILFQIH